VTQAAAAQLGVPVIAALGAILVLDEMLSARLVTSGAAILTGIGIALATRAPSSGE
jgi:drug/metabolite transporter (DMT)-like permease